jgi:hypothetical protein
MWKRFDVEIPLGRGTRKAPPRATHVDSSVAIPHVCDGRADHHQGDVAISYLGADSLRNASAGNAARAGLGFHVLSDDLDIQISVTHLGLQTLRDVVSLDIAPADCCIYGPKNSADVLVSAIQSRNHFRAIGHIDPVTNTDPNFGIRNIGSVQDTEMVLSLVNGEYPGEEIVVQPRIARSFGNGRDRYLAIPAVEDLQVSVGDLDGESHRLGGRNRESSVKFRRYLRE